MLQDPIEPIQPIDRVKGIEPIGPSYHNGESTQAQGAVMTKEMVGSFMDALKDQIARERAHQAERKIEQEKSIEGG